MPEWRSETDRPKFQECRSSILIHLVAIPLALSTCCKAGSDDARNIVLPLCVDHDRDSTMNLADRDRSILVLRMSDAEDLQVVLAALNELCGLSKGQSPL